MTSPLFDYPPLTNRTVQSSLGGLNHANVFPFGARAVVLPGSILLSDSFNGTTIDTVYRWKSPVLGGAGTVTQAASSIIIATSTTASNAGALASIDNIQPIGAGFLAAGAPIQFEAAVSTNTHRFFGIGNPNASFTAATPLSDAYGWEIDITGALNAVTYSTNVRTIWYTRAPPSDGAPHIYGAYIRADAVYFLLDNLEEAVAVGGYQQASVNQLPVRFHMINHTVGPAVAPTFKAYGAAGIDLTSNYIGAFNGQMIQPIRQPGKYPIVSAVSVAAEATIWTPASGRRFRLMGGLLTSGTVGGNVTLKDNTGGSTIGLLPFGAAASPMPFTLPGNGILSGAVNNVLTATGAATQTLSGYLIGCEE